MDDDAHRHSREDKNNKTKNKNWKIRIIRRRNRPRMALGIAWTNVRMDKSVHTIATLLQLNLFGLSEVSKLYSMLGSLRISVMWSCRYLHSLLRFDCIYYIHSAALISHFVLLILSLDSVVRCCYNRNNVGCEHFAQIVAHSIRRREMYRAHQFYRSLCVANSICAIHRSLFVLPPRMMLYT